MKVITPQSKHLFEIPEVYHFEGGDTPPMDFEGGNYEAKFSSFKNIKFHSKFSFTNVNLSAGLRFEKCVFDTEVHFNNIKTKELEEEIGFDKSSITFRDCTFNNQVIFDGDESKIEDGILFWRCNFMNGFSSEIINFNLNRLIIKECTVNVGLRIFNLKNSIRFEVSNSKINGSLLIADFNCDLLYLSNNIITETVDIIRGSCKSGIKLLKGEYKNEVSIINTFSEEGLEIAGSEFHDTVQVTYFDFNGVKSEGLNRFYFLDTKFHNGALISGSLYGQAYKPIISEIDITLTTSTKGEIRFSNLDVGNIIISGYNHSTSISFYDLNIKRIKINNLFNNSNIVFQRICASQIERFDKDDPTKVIKSHILIMHSNLGKAQFFDFDFKSFDQITLHNSILYDISTSLVKWFNVNQLSSEADENNKSENIVSLNSKRETYRQLKLSSQKQGDIPQSLEFLKDEMNFYRKVITLSKPLKWNEFFILLTNLSNDFGQNWIKAFCLLIGFSLLTYIPIGLLATNNLDHSRLANSCSDFKVNFQVLWVNLKDWLVILNPTHRIKDLDDNIDSYSHWIYFWDLFSRIIISYFIFQMISAFRKFNK